MSIYRFRIFSSGLRKPEHIVERRTDVEELIPHGEYRIVMRYQGRKKLATYMVDKDIRGGCRWTQLANG
jgi:hypothetical protein